MQNEVEKIAVHLSTPKGIRAVELLATTGDLLSIELILDAQSYKAEGSDLFEALIRIRELLLPMQYSLLVAGARVNARPSGMSRQMSQGRRVYLLEIGKPSDPLTLCDLFSPATIDQIATPADQDIFYNACLNNLR